MYYAVLANELAFEDTVATLVKIFIIQAIQNHISQTLRHRSFLRPNNFLIDFLKKFTKLHKNDFFLNINKLKFGIQKIYLRTIILEYLPIKIQINNLIEICLLLFYKLLKEHIWESSVLVYLYGTFVLGKNQALLCLTIVTRVGSGLLGNIRLPGKICQGQTLQLLGPDISYVENKFYCI